MPYLILSDIHANREALEAVLADAGARAGKGYDRILCLGDLVGYGSDPNFVTDWARENTPAIVRGNHDRACVGQDPLHGYNSSAQASAIWTRGVLTPENFAYLQNLPAGPLPVEDAELGWFDLVHGSPLHEDDYLIAPADVAYLRDYLERPLSFFGHTHLQGGFLLARGGVKKIAPEESIELEPQHFYLVNPGSVGQPRDGDPRAAYVLFWPEQRLIEFRRVTYDIEKAAAKIRHAGLPEPLALRLFQGF